MSDFQQGPGWWLASDGKWYPPQGPVSPQPVVAQPRADIPVGVWPAFAGAGLLVLGSLLPWATVTAPFIGEISKNGMDGDGVLTLILGLAVAGLSLAVLTRRTVTTGLGVAVIVVSVLALGIGIIDLVDIAQRVSDIPDDVAVSVSPGIGLYLALLGAVAGIVGGIMQLTMRPAPSAGPSF